MNVSGLLYRATTVELWAEKNLLAQVFCQVINLA